MVVPSQGYAANGGSLARIRRQWCPPCRELPPMVPSRDPPPTVVPRRDPPPTVVPSQGSTTNGGANAGICHPCWFLHQHSPPTVASTQGLTTTCGSLAGIHHQQCFLRKDPPPVVVPSQGPPLMCVSVAAAPAPYTWFLLLLNKPPTLRYGPGMSVTSQLRCPLTVQHGFRCPGTRGLHDLRQFYLRQ